MTRCPSRDALVALLDGGLSAAEESAVSEHLDGCPDCQTLMERLTDLGADPPRADEPTSPGGADGTAGGAIPGADVRLARLRKLLPAAAPVVEPATTGTLPNVPGYEIVRELGRGGMAVVYEARQTRLNRRVALKLLRTGELAAPEHFIRLGSEGAIVARLQHPNIVQIYEIGLDHAQPFLALELIEGGTLEEVQAGRPSPPATSADLVKTLAGAVEYAHARGVIHRDLKPANILLQRPQSVVPSPQSEDVRLGTGDYGLGTPKIADFGLARQIDNDVRLTQTGDLLGTPSYMAPEQVAGERRQVGPWTDVYALGGILYKLLTGHPPFRGTTTLQVLEQVTYDDPPPPSRLRPRTPRDLDVICLKCLEKDPARRYPSAAELAADLDRFLDGRPVQARPVSVVGRAYRWARRRPTIAALLALILFVAAAGLAGVVTQWRVAVAGEKEAGRLRGVAEDERDNAQRHLAQALIREARAIRLARQPGYRDQAWDRLRQAAAIGLTEADSDVVRREATACLGDFLGYMPVTLTDFSAQVTAVAVAADDTRVAIGLKDGAVVIGDWTTGRVVRHQPVIAPAEITSLTFTGRGDQLIATEAQGLVRPWAWAEAGGWKPQPPAAGRPGSVIQVSPDGRYVGVGNGTQVVLHDRETRRDVMQGSISGKVNRLAVAPAGRWVAVGYVAPGPNPRGEGTPTVVVLDGKTGAALPAVTPGLHYVYSMTFSPDNSLLACACLEGVAVYRLPGMERVDQVRGTIVHGTAFSPDGRRLAVPTEQEDQVRLWAFGAGRDGPVLAHPGRPALTAFSPSGRTLVAAGSRVVRVWGLGGTPEKRVLTGHQGGVPSVAFRPDGGELASVSKDRTVRLWDPATGMSRAVRDVGVGQAVAYTPDGRFLAIGDYTASRAQIWDPKSWQEIAAVTAGLGNRVHSVAFSQDGRYFAVGAVPGLRVFSARIGKDVSLTPADRGPPADGHVGHLGFGPDGKVLVWTSNEGVVQAWDLEAGKALPAPPGRVFARVHSLGFFPDGRRIIYLNASREAEIWDVRAGQREKVFSAAVGETAGTDSYAMHIALSPDGKTLAASSVTGRGVNLWDVEAGRLLAPLPEEPGVVWSMAWSPDGRRLAVGRSDGGLAVWDRDRVRAELESLGLGW